MHRLIGASLAVAALAFLAGSFAVEVPAGLGPEDRQRLAVDRLRRQTQFTS